MRPKKNSQKTAKNGQKRPKNGQNMDMLICERIVAPWTRGLLSIISSSCRGASLVVLNATIFSRVRNYVFFVLHSNHSNRMCWWADVLSMAVWDNPNKVGSIVATGERGAAPRIIIWSTDDVKILNTLRATHQRGVCQLAFSNDGVRNIF